MGGGGGGGGADFVEAKKISGLNYLALKAPEKIFDRPNTRKKNLAQSGGCGGVGGVGGGGWWWCGTKPPSQRC